ncbi:hypothetical protein ES332_D04G129600v1 [Gossypium tomentosum]|uniref:Uncharacterized protein n=1 Tax=Gossypium tomentosum TaxID=34277 RepID=A0A5D2LD70_GOSTO|nr:hypothetical protein ES332_D04G129600v1 [Gossypium tomentosum]
MLPFFFSSNSPEASSENRFLFGSRCMPRISCSLRCRSSGEFRSCNFSSHSLRVQQGQGILDKLVTIYLLTERLGSKATAGIMSNRVAQSHSMISTNKFF